ncbi:hypothetical protein [Sporobacter termitidis]|uniref:hypothetical protein n=1 Tax=Sporobacter termitidis TaxID=44749 RepID=UPI0011609444|nr:hypothetical protein [Sporobacter termitidis]
MAISLRVIDVSQRQTGYVCYIYRHFLALKAENDEYDGASSANLFICTKSVSIYVQYRDQMLDKSVSNSICYCGIQNKKRRIGFPLRRLGLSKNLQTEDKASQSLPPGRQINRRFVTQEDMRLLRDSSHAARG